jgi:MAE_28990/MAE_18760-like HEPN
MRSMIFYKLSDSIKPNLDIIRQSIKLNEKLRDLASRTANEIDNSPLFKELIEVIPTDGEWLGYENCAAVTRLYAVYESFVEALIVKWIEELPSLVPKHSDLDERIRETHIDNVSRILRERNKQRFDGLSLESAIYKLYCGVTNTQPYELLADAFIIHDRNLRKEDLEELLKNAGIHQLAWNWIKNNRNIKSFIRDVIQENTAEGLLKELIDYRNDAAHGLTINIILGGEELLQLCDFVEMVCESLSELATYQLLLKQEKQGKVVKIGIISEWFKNPQAGVAKIINLSNGKLKIGDKLFITSDSDCQLAEIISLAINGSLRQEIDLSLVTEVGVKFNIDARKNWCIYYASPLVVQKSILFKNKKIKRS